MLGIPASLVPNHDTRKLPQLRLLFAILFTLDDAHGYSGNQTRYKTKKKSSAQAHLLHHDKHTCTHANATSSHAHIHTGTKVRALELCNGRA